MSSELPDKLRGVAESKGILCERGARGMMFNADGAQAFAMIMLRPVKPPGMTSGAAESTSLRTASALK